MSLWLLPSRGLHSFTFLHLLLHYNLSLSWLPWQTLLVFRHPLSSVLLSILCRFLLLCSLSLLAFFGLSIVLSFVYLYTFPLGDLTSLKALIQSISCWYPNLTSISNFSLDSKFVHQIVYTICRKVSRLLDSSFSFIPSTYSLNRFYVSISKTYFNGKRTASLADGAGTTG